MTFFFSGVLYLRLKLQLWRWLFQNTDTRQDSSDMSRKLLLPENFAIMHIFNLFIWSVCGTCPCDRAAIIEKITSSIRTQNSTVI